MQELVTMILATKSETSSLSGSETFLNLCGMPALSYITEAASNAGSDFITFVGDNIADELVKTNPINELQFLQEHNISKAIEKVINDKTEGTLLVIGSDLPTITGETLKSAYEYHVSQGKKVTILTDNTYSLTDKIFNNILLFDIEFLHSIFINTNSYNDKDLLKFITANYEAGIYKVSDSSELLRVKDNISLNDAEHIILKRIIKRHLQNGVVFHLPETSLVQNNVKIGSGTVIYPGTILEGDTVIENNCEIGPYSRIQDGTVGKNVKFMNSVMIQSQIGDNTTVGPFAYIRPASKIGQNIKIGDFVEIKNSTIGDNTKVPHLTYVGDADVGRFVNFGCGSVLVNYDGRQKHRSMVGDHAFVGCNVNLVSPVVVKDYAYIAAGSTITDEVPEYALAIARNKQTIIENWVKRKGLDNK